MLKIVSGNPYDTARNSNSSVSCIGGLPYNKGDANTK